MTRGNSDNINLAVIGLGGRAVTMIAALRRAHPWLRLAAAANPESDGLEDRLRWAGLDDSPKLFPDADRLLEHADSFDALMIGTPCDLHAPLAVKVASTGLPLFLEKPVAVSYERLSALRNAYRGREGSVVVSFPLRPTPLFTAVMDVVRSGRLGAINQVQAINNVPYGGSYYATSFYREH